MYYQVGAATIRQIPYPGSGTNFPDTEKPRNSDHVGSEFRGQRYGKQPKQNWYVPGTVVPVFGYFLTSVNDIMY